MFETIPSFVYEAKPNKVIRILIEYGALWRPIIWLQVNRKGDVYLGPRYPLPVEMRVGEKTIHEGRSTHKYKEGREVTDSVIIEKGGRLSFHASGAVNAGGVRTYRDSIRTMKERSLLCLMVFQHPTVFEAPASIGKPFDVLLQYEIDELRPLIAQVYIAPVEDLLPVIPMKASQAVTLSFAFRGLKETPDLMVKVLLYNGQAGPWPPETHVVWPSNTRNVG